MHDMLVHNTHIILVYILVINTRKNILNHEKFISDPKFLLGVLILENK